MAQYIKPETRAKILSSIKDEGMSIVDAAKTFGVAEKTVRKWLRSKSHNGHTSSTEIQKHKEEIRALKEIIGDIVLRHKLNKKSPLTGS